MDYTTTCWNCGVRASMAREGRYEREHWDVDGDQLGTVEFEMYVCPDCDMPTLVYGIDGGPELVEINTGARRKTYGGEVPSRIGTAASEAYLCLSVGALRGSVVLARAVIEATCKENEIVKGLLWQKIDALRDAGLVSELVRGEAHEVRHAGNDIAHGDLDADVDKEDAADMLALMDNVLEEVYVRPAQLRERQSRRAQRKTSEPDG